MSVARASSQRSEEASSEACGFAPPATWTIPSVGPILSDSYISFGIAAMAPVRSCKCELTCRIGNEFPNVSIHGEYGQNDGTVVAAINPVGL
jgi:hypothetical protein